MDKKVVLITGASKGIGKAIALKFASKGFDLLLHFNSSIDLIKDLKDELQTKYNNSNIEIFKADLSKFNDIEKLFCFAIEKFKRIDVLVNNAGICIDEELENKTLNQFVETFKINTFAPFYLTKMVGEEMFRKKYGKIVNISSNNSINCFNPTTIDYDASKSALNSLTKNFAMAFSPFVNVNAVAPGWVRTDMNKLLSEEFMESERQKILKKKIGEPEDIANVVYFLSTEEANYINGQIIVVDGGMF